MTLHRRTVNTTACSNAQQSLNENLSRSVLSVLRVCLFETPRGSELLGSYRFRNTKGVRVSRVFGFLRNQKGRSFSGLRPVFPRSESSRHLFCAAGPLHDKIIRVSNEQAMKTVTKCTGSHAAPRNRKKKPFR